MVRPRGKGLLLLGATAVLVVIGVLGYGYWFAVTHGSFYMFATDVSDREHPRQVIPVDLSIFDAERRLLARAAGAAPDGVIYLTWPEEYACHGVERQAPFSVAAREEWDRCFARQSRWVPTWVPTISYVELRSGSCTIDRLPASAAEYRDDWWLWWVPLVHVGGKPYTSYSLSLQIDLAQCRALQ